MVLAGPLQPLTPSRALKPSWERAPAPTLKVMGEGRPTGRERTSEPPPSLRQDGAHLEAGALTSPGANGSAWSWGLGAQSASACGRRVAPLVLHPEGRGHSAPIWLSWVRAPGWVGEAVQPSHWAARDQQPGHCPQQPIPPRAAEPLGARGDGEQCLSPAAQGLLMVTPRSQQG